MSQRSIERSWKILTDHVFNTSLNVCQTKACFVCWWRNSCLHAHAQVKQRTQRQTDTTCWSHQLEPGALPTQLRMSLRSILGNVWFAPSAHFWSNFLESRQVCRKDFARCHVLLTWSTVSVGPSYVATLLCLCVRSSVAFQVVFRMWLARALVLSPWRRTVA